MGTIDKYIPEKTLELEYNSAKIIASPYDYKLSERILIMNPEDCYEKFNIFHKGYGTEKYLSEALKLNLDKPYLDVRADIAPMSMISPADFDCDDTNDLLMPLEKTMGFIGTFIKFNNLIINEKGLLTDLSTYYTALYSKAPSDAGLIKLIQKDNLLKAIEVLFTKCTAKSSLVPNLMYLATSFSNKPLADIENLTFAHEAISHGNAPLVKTIYYDDETADSIKDWSGRFLSSAIVPIYDFSTVPSTYSGIDIELNTNESIAVALYNLGTCYAIMYGCELLYYFNEITDPTIKDALEKLLSIGWNPSSICANFLYEVDSMGHVNIKDDIVNCFNPDNEVRFNNFRTYFEKTLSEFKKGPAASKDLSHYKFPMIFARLIMSLHGYAFQVARIKHATLLYTEAKSKGVIDKDDLTDVIDNDVCDTGSLFGLPSGSGTSSDDSDELIDLTTFETKGSKSLSDEDLIEKEKSVTKKDKLRGPMLNAADMLKKDLYESRYKFDINYVKNLPGQKAGYNAIASSINMITHELTRQIKEIKTYNTGGKQGGLLVGKLDKKNLWKYKTDPHIFYNNNYKLKEMDLAFGCILDESGSMHGEKIKNGRIVMVMLHEVLNSLGINHSIIGHTSSGMYRSTIYKYFQFKEEAHYTLDKPYGLISADNRDGNCDSGALYYMQSVMKSVKNKDKIVIIFSDGQPTECTDLDLTEQVRNMERDGIHVIGVGINFDSIREYYPDNANGQNLKEMVDIVVRILKRYVLEKKD